MTHGRYHHIVRHEIPWFIRHHRDLRQHVPTLHLNGEHDPLTIGTPDSWRPFADEMRFELVPGSGHFVAEERPDWVLDRVLPFLE
jgi:pimeloyl-ACP methyl ester carboxylesterase